MANKDCLRGMWCPNCGSYGPFEIRVEAWFKVDDSGIGSYTETDWGDNSAIICCCCHHVATVAVFKEPNARLSEVDMPGPEFVCGDITKHKLWLWNYLDTEESRGRQGRFKNERCPVCERRSLVEWKAGRAGRRENCLNGCVLPCVEWT